MLIIWLISWKYKQAETIKETTQKANEVKLSVAEEIIKELISWGDPKDVREG